MNTHLFEQLREEYRVVVEDIRYPTLPRALRLPLTFHPSLARWKQRFDASLRRYYTSHRCFRQRSRYAAACVARHQGHCDVALQIGGMFSSFVRGATCPRVLFVSFNTLLAYNEWRPWAPFDTPQDFQRWYRLEKQLYGQADRILCTNHYVMQSLTQDYDVQPDKLEYVGYGVNFQTATDAPKVSDGSLALFVGFDFERKGGYAVLEAFRRVREQVPHARLRIIGPSVLDKRHFCEGVEHLQPVTSRDQMRRHFAEAAFFVMPSVCEPFGLVLLEAMAHRNPCIGSTVDAMGEIIDHGRTGYLVTPGDVEALATRMTTLFTDHDLRRGMGEAAYQRAQGEFTWSNCGQRVRSALRRLLPLEQHRCREDVLSTL